MESKRIDTGTIIILDSGRNVSVSEQNPRGKIENGRKSFFECARECTGKIIEQKILSQKNNYTGLILLGSKQTKNALAVQCPGSFKHIELFSKLHAPSWQLIRDLPEKATNVEGDWFDSLIVAADHFKNGVEGIKFITKKIILMTNFKAPSDIFRETVKRIINGFKEDNFIVDVFGPDIYDSSNKNEDLELAIQLVNATGGVSVSFDYCMKLLVHHQKKAVSCIPWNVDLSFTPDVKIPVSCYIKLKSERIVQEWIPAIRNPVTNTVSLTEGIEKNKVHVNVENQKVLKNDELIKGYHYGQEIIPFSDVDQKMLYRSGEKSLKIYGFTKASNITWHHLNGDELHYVFGRKGDKKAQKAIQCLVLCLHEENLVGVVRRVYNTNNAPKLYALMPVIDSDNELCLSMAGICFKDDIKTMTFPPTNLNKYRCTEQQVDAFKDLIKAMDLMKAYNKLEHDDSEAFPIAETVSPTIQYVLDCIVFRALNPGKPLPEPRDDIMKLFKVPPLLKEQSIEQKLKLKHLFVLKKVEVKQRTRKLVSSDDVEPSNSSTNIDVEMDELPTVDVKTLMDTKVNTGIGTVDPIKDFETLMNHGKSLGELSPLMTEAIESLVYTNIDGKFSKTFNCIEFFRKQCVNSEPTYYNDWFQTFKMELLACEKNDILELIHLRKLGLILKCENSTSTFETVEQGDSQLYENDTIPTLTDMSISSQIKTFFDDM